MCTIGIVSDSQLLTDNFKKSVTQSSINYVELGSFYDREGFAKKLTENREEIFHLIVILPHMDGKIHQNPDFIKFIQDEQYHIELFILVDLAGTVRNVDSFSINDKYIPVKYYNSDEQLFNSYIKNYLVVREKYEPYYELIRRCNILTTVEFAEHITKNRSIIFGKLSEIKHQDHLDIDEFIINTKRLSRYLNVTKALGNPGWMHTEKLYGYVDIKNATAETIGNAISEITQTMDDHDLSNSKINISAETNSTADMMMSKYFGDKSFREILTMLKSDDRTNFMVIQAFDLLLDVPSLLKNVDLPDIYGNITNLIISAKFNLTSSFSRTKLSYDHGILLGELWKWIGENLDLDDYAEHKNTDNPIIILGSIFKNLEISFTSLNGLRHLINLMNEENREAYYIAMEMKHQTSDWVKQHAKIVKNTKSEKELSKYLDKRYLQNFLRKYPEIWITPSTKPTFEPSNSTADYIIDK